MLLLAVAGLAVFAVTVMGATCTWCACVYMCIYIYTHSLYGEGIQACVSINVWIIHVVPAVHDGREDRSSVPKYWES